MKFKNTEIKILMLTVSLFFVFSLSSIADILVDDGFEDYEVDEQPPTWEGLFIAAEEPGFNVVDNPTFEGNRSLQVDQPSDWASLGRKFETTAKVITYELYGYTKKDDVRSLLMITSSENVQNDNDDGKASYLAFMGDGFIAYHDGEWHPFMEYEANRWYHLACEVDLNSQTYKIYVDDMTKPVKEGAKFWHQVDKISYVIVRGSPTGDTFWVDNVFAYEGNIGTESKAVEPDGNISTTWGLIKSRAGSIHK